MLNSYTPSSCKVLQERWQKIEQNIHKKRLKEIKSSLDLKAPPIYSHLQNTIKKKKANDKYSMEVQRENQVLLKKIQNIIQSSASQPTLFTPAKSEKSIKFKSKAGGTSPSKKEKEEKKGSLNKEVKVKERIRVAVDNHDFLQRLFKQQSVYDVYKWEEEYKEREKLQKSMSPYPKFYDQRIQAQRYKSEQLLLPDIMMNNTLSKFSSKRVSIGNCNSRTKSRGFGGRTEEQQLKQHEEILIKLTQNPDIIDPSTETFHTQRKLKKHLYTISLYLTQDEKMYVTALNDKTQDMFLIKLSKKKAKAIMAAFGNDFNLLCDNLDIYKRRLVILSPPEEEVDPTANLNQDLNNSPEVNEFNREEV